MKYLKVIFMSLPFALMSLTASADGHGSKSLDDVVKMLEAQQAEIEALKAELADAKGESADLSVGTINTPQSPDSVGAQRSRWSPIGGKTLGKAAAWAERTSIGGYGELHANRLNGEDGAGDRDRVDFHRLVLFVGHEFSDSIRLATEIEIEHSHIGDGQPGDVVLELAWLEMDLSSNHHLRAGQDILPIGLLNLTHEPTTFYGVERNPVEVEVIPTTWTEAGVGLWGSIAPGWNYNFYAHTGLKMTTTGSSAFRVRSGREKVANADDQDIAFMGRLLYNGMPGLEVAVTVDYQADYTGTADAIDNDAWLTEAHIDYQHSSGLALRALYARWDFSSGDGVDPATLNADDVEGWYVEPSYKFGLGGVLPGEFGVFVRYAEWDQRDGAAGLPFATRKMTTVGASYWPHPNVVFKIDGQWESADGNPSSGTRDGVNFGLGFQF